MAKRVNATALRAARRGLRKADKDTLKRVLENIIHSFEVYGNGDEGELLVAIMEDLEGYSLLPTMEENAGSADP